MEREIIKALQKQTGLIVEIWADKFNSEYFERIEEGQIVHKEEEQSEDDKPKRVRRTREQMEQARIEESEFSKAPLAREVKGTKINYDKHFSEFGF